MTNRSGFTLVEMLFVLTILLLILSTSVPIVTSAINKQQVKQFVNVFQSDLLYLQNQSTGNKDDIRLIFKDDHYFVKNYNTKRTLFQRSYTKNMAIDTRTINYIAFNDKGTLKYPGVIYIKTDYKDYRLVFPLGKGRNYIDEQ
ncbi:competence type IV pilus minor pilin ComGD [Virgibacillus sp. W0430]|uniref:competence type IV pilus minor pilin ComGD n=1 Tax=Virgibacillus sp. W0430 TaxID=3391580 RepID=UPI003F478531